jgi:Family of unknown function (DUF6200)
MPPVTEHSGTATRGTEAPVIVDLGKHRRKAIKNLRQGQGKLMAEVSKCIQDLQAAGTVSSSAQPVVIIVREKRRKRALWPLA